MRTEKITIESPCIYNNGRGARSTAPARGEAADEVREVAGECGGGLRHGRRGRRGGQDGGRAGGACQAAAAEPGRDAAAGHPDAALQGHRRRLRPRPPRGGRRRALARQPGQRHPLLPHPGPASCCFAFPSTMAPRCVPMHSPMFLSSVYGFDVNC